VIGLLLAGVLPAGVARAEPHEARAGAELTLAVDAPGGPADEQRRALRHGLDDRQDEPPVDTSGEPHGNAGGLRISFGRAFTSGAENGWYGRLEAEGFATRRYEESGPAFGVLVGGEYWRADDGAGGGVPFTLWYGLRSPTLFWSFGFGFEMLIVDRVHDDTGVGIYVPLADTALGIELSGFRLLADARAMYRWQWGADDRAQYQVGITMSHFLETPAPRPGARRGGVVDQSVRERRSD